jgi:tRNA modification GTPase
VSAQPLSGGPVDTIVAAITAAGCGERAAVRLSGPGAFSLVERVLYVSAPARPGRAGRGRLDLGQGVGVDVLLLGFRAPRSLTGEDVVELHLPGWPVLVTELLARLRAAGARPAERGEFSRRAVASGRADLPSVLAVARLVAARSAEEAADAAAALAGGLQRLHETLRDRLLATLALVEAHVDFEEEDTEAISDDDVRVALAECVDAAGRLERAGTLAPPADGETDVALLGPPNAGKSLLFLALCPGAETTVSPLPGTTRDALEARVGRGGRRWRILDGPGVDRSGEPGALSGLDRAAMDLYLRNLPRAAVVLLVTDAAAPPSPAARRALRELAGSRVVVEVLNKCDLLEGAPIGARPGGAIAVSALRRLGLAELWRAIAAAAPAPAAPDAPTHGERRAAAAALRALQPAVSRPLAGRLPELALSLREALAALDEASDGSADVDRELLDRIFASFCIGK